MDAGDVGCFILVVIFLLVLLVMSISTGWWFLLIFVVLGFLYLPVYLWLKSGDHSGTESDPGYSGDDGG